MVVFYICGKFLSEGELAKIIDEVESLQEKNKTLEESVSHYQKVIEGNLAGVRCKELEGEVEQLKQNIKDLEEIIRDVDDFESKLQKQQAIIEFQKSDIERLVKLNAEQMKKLNFKNKILSAFLYAD